MASEDYSLEILSPPVMDRQKKREYRYAIKRNIKTTMERPGATVFRFSDHDYEYAQQVLANLTGRA